MLFEAHNKHSERYSKKLRKKVSYKSYLTFAGAFIAEMVREQ